MAKYGESAFFKNVCKGISRKVRTIWAKVSISSELINSTYPLFSFSAEVALVQFRWINFEINSVILNWIKATLILDKGACIEFHLNTFKIHLD